MSTGSEDLCFVYVLLFQIDLKCAEEEVESGKLPLHNKGEILIKFFEFLSSRKFKMLKYLSFSDLGMNSTFLRGEWLAIHQVRFKTYMCTLRHE